MLAPACNCGCVPAYHPRHAYVAEKSLLPQVRPVSIMMRSQEQQRQQLAIGKYARFNRSTHVHGVVEQTYASFVNKSTEVLRFIWLDFKGSPKVYATVQPGRDYHVYTYNTHTWVIEDALGNVWTSYVYGASPSLAQRFRAQLLAAALRPPGTADCQVSLSY